MGRRKIDIYLCNCYSNRYIDGKYCHSCGGINPQYIKHIEDCNKSLKAELDAVENNLKQAQAINDQAGVEAIQRAKELEAVKGAQESALILHGWLRDFGYGKSTEIWCKHLRTVLDAVIKAPEGFYNQGGE